MPNQHRKKEDSKNQKLWDQHLRSQHMTPTLPQQQMAQGNGTAASEAAQAAAAAAAAAAAGNPSLLHMTFRSHEADNLTNQEPSSQQAEHIQGRPIILLTFRVKILTIKFVRSP